MIKVFTLTEVGEILSIVGQVLSLINVSGSHLPVLSLITSVKLVKVLSRIKPLKKTFAGIPSLELN